MCGEHGVHPSVPQSLTAVYLEYCHHCMAWKVEYQTGTRHNDQTYETARRGAVAFGPFDTLREVATFAKLMVDELLTAPGSPWDPGD